MDDTMTTERPISTREACEALGCSRTWFEHHANLAGVTPFKLPGRTGARLWTDTQLRQIAESMGRELDKGPE